MNCPFVKNGNQLSGDGGGNMRQYTSANRLIIRRTAAIGDALCATVVAQRLTSLGFEITYQSHTNCHCVLRRVPCLTEIMEPNGYADVNLDGAYETDANRRSKHFHQMFFEKAQEQLTRFGIILGQPLNCKPVMRLPINDRLAVRERLKHYPRPWVFICPRSDTYAVRQVPDGIWSAAASNMFGTKFWIGRHPAPPNIVDLRTQHFDDVIRWLSAADLLVTVDTGPLHVAAALGTPAVAISQSSSPQWHLNDQTDYVMISPSLDCLDCQLNVCPKSAQMPPCQNIDPDLIAWAANARCRSIASEDVSAIVCVYQPELATLNRCLECLLPQVEEIIVTAEGKSIVPDNALKHPKIRYVRTWQGGIGYGRNANFGARHSNGRYLLLINDDVFLSPNAVERLLDVMRTDACIGAVSSLLRYPDGTIYHSGKIRAPGIRGWGHCNHRQTHPYCQEPMEQENTCGACVLVRREAFYAINGFDEDYYLFSEDDDFMLRLRRAGWRIFFTPHAEGIHMEHQSVKKVGSVMEAVNRANATFHRKWGWYLEHNLNRVPGNFDA